MKQYDASSPVSSELMETVFQHPYDVEYHDDGTFTEKGYEGIYLYGLMSAGKTTDIIQLFDTVCRYQEPYEGKRQIHIGVLRNSNADFMLTLGKSFGYWYEEQEKVNFKYGYKILDANIRPKVIVRFPSWQYAEKDGEIVTEYDGLDCEITYFCYSANDKGDEEKMKGGEFTCIWSNEMNNIPKPAHDMLTGRGDRYPPTGATRAFWIGDANPKNKNAWEYPAYVKPANPTVKVIKYPSPIYFESNDDGNATFKGKIGHWKIDDSVKVHRIDRKTGKPDYKYWLKMTNKSDTFVQNNVLGEYSDIREGEVVHDGFNPDRHVAKSPLIPPPYATLLVGLDFGVKCGATIDYLTDDGDFRRIKDFYSDKGFKALYANIRTYLINHHNTHWNRQSVLFIGDPRTGTKKNLIDSSTSIQLIFDDFSEDHYVVPRVDGVGAIVDNIDYRISTVDEALKMTGGFLIDPACELTIDALSFGYVLDELTGKPDKRKSGMYADVMDSGQYTMTYVSLGGETTTSYASSSSGSSAVYHAY